ncbi:hypothetical protein PZ78_07670 [Vreelandella venusta]|nr:hypothetical protein PZ78_07670 [Halomonas hydrothermalis]
MEKHREILQALADRPQKGAIDESSNLDTDAFEELMDRGFVKATKHRPLEGGSIYLNPKVTFAGREYLNQLIATRKTKRTKWLKPACKAVSGFVGLAASIIAIAQFFGD